MSSFETRLRLSQRGIGTGQTSLGLINISDAAGTTFLAFFELTKNFEVIINVHLRQADQLTLAVYFHVGNDCVEGNGFSIIESPVAGRDQFGLFNFHQTPGFLAVIEKLRQPDRSFQTVIEIVLCVRRTRKSVIVGFGAISKSNVDLRVVATHGSITLKSDGFLIGLQYLQARAVLQGGCYRIG